MIWVSSLRLPILSPPGLGMKAYLNLANSGPAIITDPRKRLLFC